MGVWSFISLSSIPEFMLMDKFWKTPKDEGKLTLREPIKITGLEVSVLYPDLSGKGRRAGV